MSWFSRLFLRRRIYSDLSEEIQQHLSEKIEAPMAQGMSRDEAEPAAKRAFGNATMIEETGREAGVWPKAENILADLKIGCTKVNPLARFCRYGDSDSGPRHRSECHRLQRAKRPSSGHWTFPIPTTC